MPGDELRKCHLEGVDDPLLVRNADLRPHLLFDRASAGVCEDDDAAGRLPPGREGSPPPCRIGSRLVAERHQRRCPHEVIQEKRRGRGPVFPGVHAICLEGFPVGDEGVVDLTARFVEDPRHVPDEGVLLVFVLPLVLPGILPELLVHLSRLHERIVRLSFLRVVQCKKDVDENLLEVLPLVRQDIVVEEDRGGGKTDALCIELSDLLLRREEIEIARVGDPRVVKEESHVKVIQHRVLVAVRGTIRADLFQCRNVFSHRNIVLHPGVKRRCRAAGGKEK